MPGPRNDREALEEELADLRADLALYQSELATLPLDGHEDVQDRRERLVRQLRREEKRIAEIEARLSSMDGTR
jgi:hypothetical protein